MLLSTVAKTVLFSATSLSFFTDYAQLDEILPEHILCQLQEPCWISRS